MSHRSMARLGAIIGILAVAAPTTQHTLAAQSPTATPGTGMPRPTAAAQFKNIKVLTDLPASDLHDVMVYMAAAVGGNCLTCHVRDANGVFAYEKDDNDHKQSARQMLRMVKAINAEHFDGNQTVTCATCHQARREPSPMPPLAEPLSPEQMAAMAARGGGPGGRAGGPGAPPPAGRAGGPGTPGQGGGRGQRPSETADQIIEKYVSALGGRDALAKVATRAIRGTVALRTGQSVPVTIEEKAGGRFRQTVEATPATQTSWTNGTAGWTGSPEDPRDVEGAELRVLTRSATLDLPLRFGALYSRVAVTRYERIGNQDVISMTGQTGGGVAETLSFDRTSGLLVRRTARVRTPLGDLPVQIDYGDYRSVDGIQVPFQVRTATWNSITTLSVSSVTLNPALDDARFEK